MVGYREADAYSNAVLDNWLMALAQEIGFRVCSAWITNETDGTVTVSQISGNISPTVTKSDTGEYLITFEDDFTNVPVIKLNTEDEANQASLSDPTISNCRVTTRTYTGSWALADADFSIMVVGR